MGYHLNSIFAVTPNDRHAYFLYFIPRDSFEQRWISDWIEQHFLEIAQRLGPEGVVIGPTPRNTRSYVREALGLTDFDFFESAFRKLTPNPNPTGDGPIWTEVDEDRYLHEAWPYLILSRSPLQKRRDAAEGFMMNLGVCESESDLGYVFDRIVSAVRRDDLKELDYVRDFLNGKKVRSQPNSPWTNSLELKPNFFGIGVNFNYLLERLGAYLLERRSKGRGDTGR